MILGIHVTSVKQLPVHNEFILY